MTAKQQVVPAEQTPVAPIVETGSIALMRLIEQAATNANFDVDKLQKLLDVKTQWEATEARKAFVVAMTEFKENPPTITRDKHVNYTTKAGPTVDYKHASLDQVSAAIGKALSEHEISHDWDIEQLDGGQIKVTCILTHSMGHSKRVSMQSSADQTGGKNNIQAIASAVTYLQRYTLLSATGMAAQDQDDDGRTAEPDGKPEPQRTDYEPGALSTLLDEFGEETFSGPKDEFIAEILDNIERLVRLGNATRLRAFYEFNEPEIVGLGDARKSEDRQKINRAFNDAKANLPSKESADG